MEINVDEASLDVDHRFDPDECLNRHRAPVAQPIPKRTGAVCKARGQPRRRDGHTDWMMTPVAATATLSP